MFKRFSVRRDPDRTFSVVDLFTGHPSYDDEGRRLRRLERKAARLLAIRLNIRDALIQESVDTKPPYA